MKFLSSIIIMLLMALNLNAQLIEGFVIEEEGNPVIGANIFDLNQEKGTSTDTEGFFKLNTDKNSIIIISAIGYETDTITVNLTSNRIPLKIVLKENTNLLDEIVVKAKSTSTIIREQAYAVEVVEAKEFKNLSTNANAILSKISGINIRESGGLGGDFSLSLNGLSGNQVRIFLNGVPMDYFGTSLSLNNFSANIIDQIEVYKGVVPVHLSSDALGGAINVITNKSQRNYLDAAYSFGSFTTHIATLNGQYRFKKSGFTNRFKSFLNTTANNYKVPVKLVNFETGQRDENENWLKRFHDGYESKMLWYEAGFTGKQFADELMVGVLYSDNYKELQQPANAIGQANIPYGEVFTREDKWITNLVYRKSGMLSGKLSISTYGVGVFSKSESVDTASVTYNWYGESRNKLNNTTGEIENRKTLLRLETKNYLANINTEYALTEQQSITLNYSLNDFELQGSDPYKDQNNTQFSNPNKVRKQVYAGSFTSTFWDKRIKTTAFGKHYLYQVNSLQTNYAGTEITPFKNKKNYTGWGATASLKISDFQLKTSYERATRFPDIAELFGDGLNIVPSPTLLPEISNNFNIGLLYSKSIDNSQIFASLNTFLRDAKDFIIPVVQGLKVYHINNSNVLSRGIDLALGYHYKNKIMVSLNGTYVDLRDNNRWRNGQVGLENSLYRARIPNVPYLFGKLSVSYRNENLFTKSDNYSISLSQNYVNEFYYRWEALASQDKSVVPSQYATDFDLVYSFDDNRYNCSFSLRNLFNTRLYDNFQQIRPGRNFNVKLRYFIK